MIHVAPATSAEELLAASPLLDEPVLSEGAADFLARPGHHLLLARLDDDPMPVGFVSGVVMAHPDKGAEMFLYELGVDESARGRGVGRSLVEALSTLAREQGCYGMWVLTDHDNDAALATYRGAGADAGSTHLMLTWTFGD